MEWSRQIKSIQDIVSLLNNLLERACTVIMVLKEFDEFRSQNPLVSRIVG